MALKMDRQVDAVELGYFLNTVQSRGSLVCESTQGSGVALDSPSNVCVVAATASGLPLGLLLNDFVNLDLTRTPLNWHKDQAQVGNKATILTKGWVVTDQVVGPVTAGQDACLDVSGLIKAFSPGKNTNVALNPKVGHFRSGLDENNFAKVYIDL